MSWKPCRGGRMLLDKAVKNSHDCYFQFQVATSLKEKSKIAFKWYKADEYLSSKTNGVLRYLGESFINECKQSNETYKPFKNLLNNLN